MNVHQLELFYHVVRHRSVSLAARALDKEQPTLSKQINDLEDSLQTKLYHRRPFRLTDKGELLYQAVEPFFRELPRLEERVKGGDILRIGASPIILMQHLPAIDRQVRKVYPKLRLILREANQPELVQELEQGEIDLAITLLPRDPPRKVFVQELVALPMILLVPKSSKLKSAEEVLRQHAASRENLICLRPEEMICREFQSWLRGTGVDWTPRIEVGSLSLVEHYVEEGYGIGLSFRIPGGRISSKLRALELPECPSIPLGMMWRDSADKLLKAFRIEAERRADQIRQADGR